MTELTLNGASWEWGFIGEKVMLRNKLWLIIMVLISISILYGCGKQQGSKEIEIQFLNWETGPTESKFINDLIKTFEEKEHGIKVKNLGVPPAGYQERLMMMIAGKSPLDIFEANLSTINADVLSKACLNLEPFMDKDPELSINDFFEPTLYTFRCEGLQYGKGPVYGLPKDWSTMVLFYNKDLFDKAGIAYPEGSWTWREIEDASKKLTIRDDSGRLVQVGALLPDPIYFVYQNGGKIWSEDGKTCLLDSPEAIETYQYFLNLEMKYKVSPSRAESQEMNTTYLISIGKVGLWFHYRFLVPILVRDAGDKFKWGVAPLIHKEGYPRLNPVEEVTGWFISRHTKYPEEAYKFFKFLVGEQGQIKTAEMGWNIPSMKKIAYSKHFLTNPNHRPEVNRVFLDEVEYLYPIPMSPYISARQFKEILRNEYDLARIGDKELSSSLRDAVQEINKEIEKNLKRRTE